MTSVTEGAGDAGSRARVGQRAGGVTIACRRALAHGVLAALASMAAALPARADCVSPPVDVPRALREATLVFAGTVTSGTPDHLTFRPGRVWKGRASKEVTIYLVGRPNAESHRFRPGETYLVFAHVVGAHEDPDDLPTGVLAMPRGCGSPPWPLTLASELDEIARPRVVR